jgi:hypothetical protein
MKQPQKRLSRRKRMLIGSRPSIGPLSQGADMSRLLPVLADPAGGPPTRGRPGGQRRAAAARGVQRVAPARPLPPAARRSPAATSGSATAARPGSQAAPLLTQPLSPGRAGSGGETSGVPRAARGGRRRRPQHEQGDLHMTFLTRSAGAERPGRGLGALSPHDRWMPGSPT